MSRLHIMEQTGPNRYRVIAHTPTPGGNNQAGFLISTVIVNSGNARTEMVTGTGPGQITSAEAAQVVAGTVIEAALVWDDDPAMTGPQRQASLNTAADQAIADTLAILAQRLKWYGRTVT